jgi:hypothetical protein
VNIPSDFMTMACDFLSCSESSLSFKSLAIPVGANPNVNVRTNIGSFEYEIEYVNHRYISLGERIVLLNSVLNIIPIFYLSFLKMPMQVWRKVRVQIEFL